MIDATYLREGTATKLIRFGFLAFILVALLFPFVEMLSTALKPRITLYTWPPVWFPAAPRWQSFSAIWSDVPLALYF